MPGSDLPGTGTPPGTYTNIPGGGPALPPRAPRPWINFVIPVLSLAAIIAAFYVFRHDQQILHPNFAGANLPRIFTDPPPRPHPTDNARTLLTNLGWGDDGFPDGYHDAEPLANPSGTVDIAKLFAWAFASPWLSNFEAATQFDLGPTLVAIVDVPDPTALAQNPLKLVAGPNCVFLHHQGGATATTWNAYVGKPKADLTTCPIPADLPGAKVDAFAVKFGSENGSYYPPTVRFTERTTGETMLGVRCGNQWCEVGGTSSRNAVHQDIMTERKAKVKGWHDEQVLWTVVAGTPTLSGVRASVVPDEDIQTRSQAFYMEDPGTDSNQGYRQALRVFVDPMVPDPTLNNSPYGYGGTSPKPNRKQWGFAKAKVNTIELRFDGTNWQARTYYMNGVNKVMTDLRVFYVMTHGNIPIPGTTRWYWTSADDAIWIPCAEGCCIIEEAAK